MNASEKPGVLERLGSALNSSSLQSRDEVVGAVDLITAMAYSQSNASAAAHAVLEEAVIDHRTELAALLVRLKYAGDGSVAMVAALKLEHWVTHQRAFRRWKLRPGQSRIFRAFVQAGLDEWLNPVCVECCGRQLVGLEREEIVEKRIRCARCRGRGWLQEIPRYTAHSPSAIGKAVRKDCSSCRGGGWRTQQRVSQRKTDICWKCKGTGLRIAGDLERAQVLGIDVRVYERHWDKRFTWLAAALDRLDHTEKRSLQSWLKSDISRA